MCVSINTYVYTGERPWNEGGGGGGNGGKGTGRVKKSCC